MQLRKSFEIGQAESCTKQNQCTVYQSGTEIWTKVELNFLTAMKSLLKGETYVIF